MLLAQLIQDQTNRYAQIQDQIDQLLEQQRQIQAYLQQLGSVESKMESAAALIAEAVTQIRLHCPDELTAYQETINSLFGQSAIATLPEATDTITTEPQPDQPTPPDVMEVITNEPELPEVPNTMPDEYLEQGLESLKVHQLKKLCKQLGITPKRYKNDLLSQLKQWKRSQEGINSQERVA